MFFAGAVIPASGRGNRGRVQETARARIAGAAQRVIVPVRQFSLRWVARLEIGFTGQKAVSVG